MAWPDWIGRSARQQDILTHSTLARFRATIDSDQTGEVAEQAIHWCLCLPEAPSRLLGDDGHPQRDGAANGLFPPTPLPRRMWAASDVRFHAPIRVDAAIVRQSAVAAITEKSGHSGPLLFVEIDHEITSDGTLAIEERQTVVFRAATTTKPNPISPPAPEPPADRSDWPWQRAVRPSAALLFRYSALTFNSHRIHYDRPYARDAEGYPNLVVHGPLTATLLLDLAQRKLGSNALARFEMRALAPAFVGEILHLIGRPSPDGWDMAARAPDGRTVMTAKAAVI